MKNPGGGRELLVSNSVTTLDESAAGRVVIAGSHCGIYAAYLAARAGARAVILNDAGVGKESAGIGGLAWLAALGIPAAALGHRTARIGDGPDAIRRGTITHVNAIAEALGCRPGDSVADCAARFATNDSRVPCGIPAHHEGRRKSVPQPHLLTAVPRTR